MKSVFNLISEAPGSLLIPSFSRAALEWVTVTCRLHRSWIIFQRLLAAGFHFRLNKEYPGTKEHLGTKEPGKAHLSQLTEQGSRPREAWGWQVSALQEAPKEHSGCEFQHTAMWPYLRAQREGEAQSAHGEELVVVRSEQAVEVPSLGRSW